MSFLTEDTFKALKTYHNSKNRNEYYRCLLKADPYGKLALSVVEQSLFSGRFAEYIATYDTIKETINTNIRGLQNTIRQHLPVW